MLTEEQANCPKCKVQFTDLNPPRLLTMCGHTFCQKCIRDLMLKKKMNNKYKLTCPFDKMSIELSTPNPTTFPKNLSVLNLAKKKTQNDTMTNRVSLISRCKSSESFHSRSTILGLEKEMKQSMGIPHITLEDQCGNRRSILSDDAHHNTCLLHQKVLQLVCTRDLQKICPSCVIFGEHRGHNVKNAHEVQQMAKNLNQKLRKIVYDSKNCFQRLQSRQISQKLDNLIKSKRNELQKQITKKFKFLLEQVAQIQRKTVNKLDRKIEEYKSKIFQNLNERKGVREKYKDWQRNIEEKIQILQDDNQDQKLKITLKSDNFVEVSEKNLELFKSLEKQILNESEHILDNLAINSDDQEIKKCLRDYCKFEDCTNSFLDMNASRITNIMMNEQILLDDIQEPIVHVSVIRMEQPQEKFEVNIKKTGSVDVFRNATSRLNRLTSQSKEGGVISSRKSSGLKSTKNLMFGTQRSSLHISLKSKLIPQKYEEKIQQILNGNSDTLDLTNGELTNEKVIGILQCLKNNPASIVKLVRNRLTDEFLPKALPFLNNSSMLNLTRNELTQKSVEYILNTRKQGGLKLLKSLMIGQNKIVERKNKNLFQELKKLGINVCL